MKYSLETCKCDLCGNDKYSVVWDKQKREKQGKLFGVVIRDDEGNIVHGRNVMCTNCGLVYVNPRMTKTCLEEFYQEEYRNIYGTGINFEAERHHANNAYRIINREIKYIPFDKKILEVGCSCGWLLQVICHRHKDIGISCVGIEPNLESFKFTKQIKIKESNLPIEIVNTDFNNWESKDKFYIAIMLNTLEHVYSPIETLTKVYSLLEDDGYLLISVPNIFNMNIKRRVDVYLSCAHIYTFSKNVLFAFLNSAGFDVLSLYHVEEEIGNKIYILAKKTQPQKIEFVKAPKIDVCKFLENIESAILELLR